MVSAHYFSPLIAGRLSPASFTSASSSGSPSPPPQSATDEVRTSASSASRAQGSGHARKYACPHCTRTFARAFNLKTHIATHDPHRQKPHVCPHSSCDHRSFSRKHDLARHLISIHHGDPAPPSEGGSPSSVSPSSPPSGHIRLPPMKIHPPRGMLQSGSPFQSHPAPQIPRMTHPSLAPLLNPVRADYQPSRPTHANIPPLSTSFSVRPTHPSRHNSTATFPLSRVSVPNDDIYSEDESSSEEDELEEEEPPRRSPLSESSGSGHSGVGVAAGTARGWCDDCGRGWVGKEKTCSCEADGLRVRVVKVKKEDMA